jgi:hypothetical protein
LQAVVEPYYWWINPVSSQPDQGSPVYRYVILQNVARIQQADSILARIYDSVNLRYRLHADFEVLKDIGSTNFCYTPV